MITIQKLKTNLPEINQDFIKLAIGNTLSKFNQAAADVTIRLTNDDEIAQLNHKYRGISSSTDVLAFNQNFQDPETGRLYLGDIIISVETVRDQAPKYSLTVDEECAFLAIHGTLHLLGFNHAAPEEKEAMWKTQERIFLETKSGFEETTE